MTDRDHRTDDSLAGLLAEFGLSFPGEREQTLPVALRGLHQVILQEFTVRGHAPAGQSWPDRGTRRP